MLEELEFDFTSRLEQPDLVLPLEIRRQLLLAFTEVLHNVARHSQANPESCLSAREVQVLQRMAEGDTKKEIATHLDISVHTVVTHLRNIYQKLHVTTNTAAVARAIREGLI